MREEEIAAIVGTVRVHVSRSLKTLAALGAITLDREAICIADMNILEDVVRTNLTSEGLAAGPSQRTKC
jgi:hypothetical protein